MSGPIWEGSTPMMYEIVNQLRTSESVEETVKLLNKYGSTNVKQFLKFTITPPEWKDCIKDVKFACDQAPLHFAVSTLHREIKSLKPLIKGNGYDNMSDEQTLKRAEFVLTQLIYDEAILLHELMTGELEPIRFLEEEKAKEIIYG